MSLRRTTATAIAGMRIAEANQRIFGVTSIFGDPTNAGPGWEPSIRDLVTADTVGTDRNARRIASPTN
jgi:hypothetical protein